MDIVELKGINSKMLNRNASSMECVPTTIVPVSRKHRRVHNEAYCDFDIIANYKQEKQQRKHKQHRERKEKTVRKSELSKKIEDLTARNVKIKQQMQGGKESPARFNQTDDKASAEKRHRDHKSRRKAKEPDKSSEVTSEKKSDKSSGVVKIRLDSSSTRDEKRTKHRSRKERSEESNACPDDTSTSRTGTITVTVTGSKDTRSRSRRTSDMSDSRNSRKERFTRKEAQIVEEVEQAPESKSQLMNVYNYRTKSEERQERADRAERPERHKEDAKKVITVFENNHVIEETDSLMSRDTLKRSKTRTQSFSRERSLGGFRDNVDKIEHKPRVIIEDDDGGGKDGPKRRAKSFMCSHHSPDKVHRREMSPIYSISPRKELSFSNLILRPTVMLYNTPPRIATTQTSVSRIQTPGFGTRGVTVDETELDPEIIPKISIAKTAKPVLSQATIALRDIMQVQELEQQQSLSKNNHSPSRISPDFVSKKMSFSKNSKFHKSKVPNTDHIVEISSKVFNQEKVKFTVEGVEPPKRMPRSSNDNAKSMKTENIFTLQVFPGITITDSDTKKPSHGNANIIEKMSTFKATTIVGKEVRTQSIDDTKCKTCPKFYLPDTRSEFKPKNKLSEVSYKFRKKCWSSKELPKKKSHKDQTKSKKEKRCKGKNVDGVKTLTRDASMQTIDYRDHLVEAGVMVQNLIHRVHTDMQTLTTLDIGVSTPPCCRDCSKHIQVGSMKRMVPYRGGSQSDSNITANEQFVCCHDYGTCTEKGTKPSNIVRPIKKFATKQVGGSSSPIDIRNAEGTNNEKIIPTKTRECCVTENRTRKYSQSCSPKPRQCSPSLCNPVMSTGSIKKVPVSKRKSRSKSVSHTRDSLVEKINYNKQTIMHHHQEIAALEKCLNEILHRLVRKESEIKNCGNCDEALSKNSDQSFNDLSNESIKAKSQSMKAKLDKSKIPTTMSKFHKGKAYGEKLKQRAKRSRELAMNASLKSCVKSVKIVSKTKNSNSIKNKFRKCHDYPGKYSPGNISPVKIRSVYKNSKGFISSATSLSSKISDLVEFSSSTYPQSIPSLNIGYSAVSKQPNCLRAISSTDHKRTNIIKKKHKIHNKGPVFSKKKSQSIYDMLKEYINLANTSSSKFESAEMQAIMESVSKIIVLSVSSLKLKHTSKYLNALPPSTIAENTTDSLLSVDAPKDRGAISKRPFFMSPTSPETAPTAQNTQDLTSADSLEYDTHTHTQQHTPDLCPLTAIFNFEPPSYAYLVYNTEIITNPNAPKIEPQPGTSYTPPASHKLLPIIEERPTPVHIAHVTESTPSQSFTVIYHENDKPPIADISPVLCRKGYPSYSERLKELELMTSDLPEIKEAREPRLTSFNCNDKECSQLIFNYTSKRDKRYPKLRDNQPGSSAYNTMTTMDSKSVSAFSDSETCLKNANESSGYESSKKSSSFKNFFKKRTLLDVFKSKRASKKPMEEPSMTSLKTIAEQRASRASDRMLDPEEEVSPYADNKTVLWFNFRRKKREMAHPCDAWCGYRKDQSDQTTPEVCKNVCHSKKTKCMGTGTFKSILTKECPCNLQFDKQEEKCQKYASKVLMDVAKRQEGYKSQYEKFDEMPLNVLIDKRTCACKPLAQSCPMTYANKAAGIQVKQQQRNQPVQVKEVRPKPPLVSIKEPEKPPPVEDKKPKNLGDDDFDAGLLIQDVSDEVESKKGFLSDKEIFEKLLNNFERKESIALKLSNDDKFFNEQIEKVNAGLVIPDLQVQERKARDEQERMRGPRFSDKPRPLVQVTNADTIVKPDDIGTCFARGFRPDNLMLSGDACFHVNKQDKIKMSPYMLKNTESIIDFSERETPLDFLLALGFMVDEASNALKDDDIRSRLFAAITEARVWINKITTTQGTLLYLVAYKARPETMRYFLQLVEAIINKRINNAIRLDGFLRVLEDVEAGRIQMINILGEDKFEDEENEEKIVKKQLKNLFITVYATAEKEASVSGRILTGGQISLLRILVAKYRAGLHPHLELIARYIGQTLLETEIQLEAAMIFLSRLDTAEVKLKEFENYCGITCQLQDT